MEKKLVRHIFEAHGRLQSVRQSVVRVAPGPARHSVAAVCALLAPPLLSKRLQFQLLATRRGARAIVLFDTEAEANSAAQAVCDEYGHEYFLGFGKVKKRCCAPMLSPATIGATAGGGRRFNAHLGGAGARPHVFDVTTINSSAPCTHAAARSSPPPSPPPGWQQRLEGACVCVVCVCFCPARCSGVDDVIRRLAGTTSAAGAVGGRKCRAARSGRPNASRYVGQCACAIEMCIDYVRAPQRSARFGSHQSSCPSDRQKQPVY